MDFPKYAQLISDLGTGLFVVVVFGYFIIKVLPKILLSFQVALEKQQETYAELSESQRKDYRDEMRLERESNERNITRIVMNGKQAP